MMMVMKENLIAIFLSSWESVDEDSWKVSRSEINNGIIFFTD